MATYDDVLFLGGDLDKPITISAANRYIRRIRDAYPLTIGVPMILDVRYPPVHQSLV